MCWNARVTGRLRIVAAIPLSDAAVQILDCLGLSSRAPSLSPAVSEFTIPNGPVVFNNSIPLKSFTSDGVGFLDAKGNRSFLVPDYVLGRMDEPAPTVRDRISDGRKSGSSRANWQSPFEVQRPSAQSIGGESEETWSPPACAGGDDRHA